MGLIKTVFHVHTDYSPDSNSSPEELVAVAVEEGVDCITITDHDTLEGARAVALAARDSRLRVIIGEEVTTKDGHLIGLFLREHVRPGQSVRQTAEHIREQGGLVVVPHPFTRLLDCGVCGAVHEILDLIDLVEVYNSQNVWRLPDWRSARFARRHGFAGVVGSDAHMLEGLTASFQRMPDFDGPVDFVESVRQAEPVTRRHAPRYYLGAAWRITRHRIGLGLPAGFGRNCSNPIQPRFGARSGTRASSRSAG